ncbi:MAG: hypothetical protein KDC98_13795 [Planctomycetes bacterium]|nr:hypothetical protein [Planctomycetota bacterium]
MRVRLLPLLLLSPILSAQLDLGAIAKVARARAERARPTQEKALEPFLADLSLDYRNNREFLDQRITQAATLGDSVVPILLEKLQPAQNSEAARHLAGNCRRVLALLDPSSFVDALAELLQSRSETGRWEAIRLLGHARTRQAERLLIDLVDRTNGTERYLVLYSLRQLASPAAAEVVVPLLGSTDSNVRDAVLNYLIAAKAGRVADTVVNALGVEKDGRLMPLYIEYFAVAVKAHDGAARALIALLGEGLDWQDKRQLVRALTTVAPEDHEPTRRRLHELLDAEETSALAVEAAVTLRAIGDRQGATRLKRRLDELLRRPQRKREVTLYEQRASLLFATEEYADAAEDYEKIIEYSRSTAMTRRAYIGLIHCEAYRRRWSQLVRVMERSEMTVEELSALAAGDDRLQQANENDKVRSFLRNLAKKHAPR